MMIELSKQLDLCHDNSTPYYPQANGRVEFVNKFLTNMIKRVVGIHKGNWHSMFFPTLWAYHTTAKTFTSFIPFELVYDLEVVLSIECEIPSLKLAIELLPTTSVEEEHSLHLAHLDETRCEATFASEAN